MGHLLSTILISISVNLDSFAIGIAYGVKKIKIGLLSNLAIATVTTLTNDAASSAESVGTAISSAADVI